MEKHNYKCRNFKPYELVPPEIYNSYNDANRDEIYELFEKDALITIDLIRDWAGVGITINNWYWGGARRDSGYRAPDSKVGASKSAHKPDLPIRRACAFDQISTKLTAQQLWAIIDKNAHKLPAKIRIEKTSGGKPITWLHTDTNSNTGNAPAYFKANPNSKVYYFAA